MTITKNKSLLMLALVATLGLAACSDKDETAGERIDEVVSDTKSAAKDAGEKVKDAAKDAGNAIEDACEDVKDKMKAKDKDC